MKVLVSPLDWGLGHATRTIPIIEEFLLRGCTVELAVSGRVGALYKGQFPDLKQIEIPGYDIRYPSCGFAMPFWLLRNGHRLMNVMRQEEKNAEELVEKNGYDVIVSDNRFGFRSKKAYSIYMTHQLDIAFPGPFATFEKVGIAWHAKKMSRFDAVWVPDFAEYPGMAGKLSHVPFANVEYVGPLSRFASLQFLNQEWQKKYRFVAILSGPEPLRSSFENSILKAFEKIPGNHALIRGLPGDSKFPQAPSNVTLFNHLETADFAKIVQSAEHCISRPGYSTVMDMVYLGADCIFVPTPGQTEQVYLGKMLHRAQTAGLVLQSKISAKSLELAAKENRRGWNFATSGNALSKAIDRVMAKLSHL
ncbi:MAG: glycosyl transferase family 28 [Fibrobacter sp.]|nr:glycosyl transferase family 28 [Fibrobacter sp.]